MAFPTIDGSNTSEEATNVTAHTVLLPSGIVAGKTLVAIFGNDGNAGVTFDDAGWVRPYSRSNGAAVRLSFAFKKATGSEGASTAVTTTAAEKSAHITYLIGNADDPDINAPEAESVGANGSDAFPDAASFTPSGGALDYLWLTFQANDFGRGTNAFPVNYGLGQLTRAVSGNSVGVAAAARQLNAATENPGAFEMAAADQWNATVIAIFPSVPVDERYQTRVVRQAGGYF